MKKLWFLLLIPILGLAALLAYQNRPEKRHWRHLEKARLFAREGNFTAAQLEYERAYNAIGTYTPYVSLEVLDLMNRKSLQEKNPGQALENTRMYVKAYPESKQGRVTLARLAFEAGELQTAFESIEAALRLDPDHFQARMLLTLVRTRQGRLDLAEEQLRYVYAKHPDSLHAILPLADNLLKQGRAAESREFLKKVLADHPGSAEAMLLLVDGYIMERKADSAEALLEGWRSRDPAQARPLAIRRARFLTLRGKHAEAESSLAAYLEPRSENAVVLMELAMLHAIKGSYDSAIRVYSLIGENLPNLRGATIRHSILLYLKNLNPAKALEQAKLLSIGNRSPDHLPVTLAAYVAMNQDNKARELVAQQPDSLREGLNRMLLQWEPTKEYIGHWALVEYFRMVNQGYRTLLATQELYRKWPGNGFAAVLFAGQLASFRQYAAAAKVLEDAPGKTPAMRTLLLSSYINGGQRDKAKALAERLLAENPKQAGLNAYLADYAWFKGDKEKGIALYRKELELNPNDPVSLNNLAWEFGIERGDLAKAGPYLERLMASKLSDDRIWDTIGWVLAKNGKLAEGEKYLREALNLVPDHPSYLYHLGWIRAQAGDAAGARALMEKAARSKIPSQDRKSAEAFLAGRS